MSQSRESELQTNCPVCVPMPSDTYFDRPEGAPGSSAVCPAHRERERDWFAHRMVLRISTQPNVEREWSPYPYGPLKPVPGTICMTDGTVKPSFTWCSPASQGNRRVVVTDRDAKARDVVWVRLEDDNDPWGDDWFPVNIKNLTPC